MKNKKIVNKNDKNAMLKKKYLEYYGKLPVQKLAAASIGKDQDTIINWKNKDKSFYKMVESAKAKWALEKCKGVKSEEWLLERVMNNHFGKKLEVSRKRIK